MEIQMIIILGLLIGVVGTGLGGLLIILLGKPTANIMSAILGFAGGIMLIAVFSELIPEALEIAGVVPTSIGIILGILLVLSMDFILPHKHLAGNDDLNSSLIKTGIVLSISIALHNIPEGIAVGISFAADQRLGYTIALIMLVQNIPEGMAMAAPLYIGGSSKLKTVGITALSGVPMGIGVLIAAIFSTNIPPAILAGGLGFAAGAMLFIIFDEMIPSANIMGQGKVPAIGTLIGIQLGIVISFLGSFPG